MSIQSFAERFNHKVRTENSRTYGSTSIKKQLLNYLDKEIKILNDRDDLTIQFKKKHNGEITDVKEIRSWKQSSTDPNIANVTLRLKNKIFGFGGETDRHTPTYIEVEYTKKSVLNKLNQLKEDISSMDENDELFGNTK